MIESWPISLKVLTIAVMFFGTAYLGASLGPIMGGITGMGASITIMAVLVRL